jgi:hypothetical protein
VYWTVRHSVAKRLASCGYALQPIWHRSTPGASESAGSVNKFEGAFFMTMTLSVGPLIALIAGVLILVMPRLLNYIVALYLILIGLLGLFTHHGSHII